MIREGQKNFRAPRPKRAWAEGHCPFFHFPHLLGRMAGGVLPYAAAALWACLFLPFGARAQAAPAAQGGAVFLKAFYALDEPRFLCVDIPGHHSRVNVAAALVVHTCKEAIWNLDERFDPSAISTGRLRMPEYGLCVSVGGARLFLRECAGSALQTWEYINFRLRLKRHLDKCLTIGPEPSRVTRGGRRNASRNMARSLILSACSDEAFERQLWRMEPPLKRSSPILPLK
ncbi:MAG: hypothetical protein VCF07_05480 [Nitrospinota bacterium]